MLALREVEATERRASSVERRVGEDRLCRSAAVGAGCLVDARAKASPAVSAAASTNAADWIATLHTRLASPRLDTPPPWDSECLIHYSNIRPDVCSKPFQSTYYDARMRAAPALLRARAPYLIKNTVTGFAVCTLVIGICTPAAAPAVLPAPWLIPHRHIHNHRHLPGRVRRRRCAQRACPAPGWHYRGGPAGSRGQEVEVEYQRIRQSLYIAVKKYVYALGWRCGAWGNIICST
jgi:hypothetical protein